MCHHNNTVSLSFLFSLAGAKPPITQANGTLQTVLPQAPWALCRPQQFSCWKLIKMVPFFHDQVDHSSKKVFELQEVLNLKPDALFCYGCIGIWNSSLFSVRCIVLVNPVSQTAVHVLIHTCKTIILDDMFEKVRFCKGGCAQL